MMDITNIKRKFYGIQRENESKRQELKAELETLYNNCLHIFPCKIFYQNVFITIANDAAFQIP